MKQPIIIRLHDGDQQRLQELAGDFIELASVVCKVKGVTKPQALKALKLAVLYDISNELNCIREHLEAGQN